jgi:hypothetical protein
MSSVYYPSVVVNMTLRFDEAFHVFDVASVSPDDLATKALNPVSFIQKLTPQPLLSEAGATPPGTPFGPQTENESQRLTTLLNRIPKTANIELPGYRQAGKFSLTFDYRDLPVDPRLLRSVAIHIYIGAVPAKNFSDGMVGFNSDGGRSSILTPSINNLMLAGIVDTWSVTHTGTVSEIHMEGRDHRGWLLDTVIDPTLQKSLVLTKPIDDVVRQILGKHPQGKNINVSVYPEDWGLVANPRFGFLPLPSPGDPTVQTRSRKGANGQQSKAGPPGDTNKISYWLLITQYCQLVGATPVFRNDELIIRPARALWDQQDGGLSPEFKTPFVNGEPRNVTLGEAGQQTVQPIKIRRLVYGRDISSMTFGQPGQRPRVQEAGVRAVAHGRGAGTACIPARAHHGEAVRRDSGQQEGASLPVGQAGVGRPAAHSHPRHQGCDPPSGGGQGHFRGGEAW